jgi:hypothetical protein
MRAGDRYARLVALRLVEKRGRNSYWEFQCDCGSLRRMKVGHVTSGHTKSCGCLSREVTSDRSRRHGKTGTQEYFSWRRMLERCNNQKAKDFDHYGGRGIKVCDRWLKFENFLADIGNRPIAHSLDRINNNGNYEPGNCRWATQAQQLRNRRITKMVEFRGQKIPLIDACEIVGISYNKARQRIDNGWDIQRALESA